MITSDQLKERRTHVEAEIKSYYALALSDRTKDNHYYFQKIRELRSELHTINEVLAREYEIY